MCEIISGETIFFFFFDRIAYHVAGLLTKHCYKIIYSRVRR